MSADATVTQEELDSLLASLAGAEAKGQPARSAGWQAVHEARVHDFARSEGLPRPTVQLLEGVHAAFAHGATLGLSSYLRSRLQISLLSIDQLTYHQFVRSIPDPTVIAVITVSPLPGQAVLELNPAITFWMIDRLLGGEGEVMKTPRPLTYLERAIMHGPVSRMLSELAVSWQECAPIKPELVGMTSTATGAQVAGPTDAVVAVSFEISVESLTAMASICLPVIALKLGRVGAAQSPLSGQAQARGGADQLSPRAALAAIMETVPIECAVRLGQAEMTAADVARLRKGDIVLLDRQVSSPLRFFVGNVAKFQCRPRAGARRMAVEILSDL